MENSIEANHPIDVLESIAKHYDVSNDFDRYNTMLAERIIIPFCREKKVMEIGCATGEMTEHLVSVAAELTVVEPSVTYCEVVKKRLADKKKPIPRFINSFLSDVNCEPVYDVVVLASLLHHVDDPPAFLIDLKRFLHKGSQVIATVPNMTSLHRRIGVKAGFLADVYSSTERNDAFNQYGRFDNERLVSLFSSCGYKIMDSYGYMLKPFNSRQMMSLHLEAPVIDALFELGKEYQELASQIFIRASMSQIEI